MNWSFSFFVNAVLFGAGLAMDAMSVSMANGLNEPDMKKSRVCTIAGTFGVFQTAMPLLGWVCVHTVANIFMSFQKLIPWIALVLLLFIGGKMLIEGIKNKDGEAEKPTAGAGALAVQGIATSIDALSVGFTIAEYSFTAALVEALIIGFVTFWLCIAGLYIGKKFGMKLANKATIAGGVILIAIGIEIFVKGIFG